ncbi:MAG: bifunctional phosphopantothenoylcysteine decarboxylase/phosphopantothenate--cysteine ligase CoaBC [Candidatus Nitrosopumilus limneticus]|nr:Phosphopantothenoylcysteine decarboxylase / Phosphopantothenate--cysteine ligase [Candidatus Nitrosopumilus limneticus]MDC4212057.1 bifunctional phosphopantothenoylcysteine decarboxylase/phosphopantothenate--cysteine ligase CoaBC [Candidatus Nitrosopumilus limneticus]MDC4213753.1 bifunctional phosphopantothenoylcysteine decarboxylase/phosphopantothenate--cysteine ligase CoaBC [Candidatus Nitrosopumilus limneticus]MDC4214500.1 bifunctional phosphopantothenoylcysteine decarboxylase/phosphopanto
MSKIKLEHPSLDIVESKGTELSGKKIVLCVAGSVAAYKSIELARLLMRHGAKVTCVMSSASTKMIQPDYMKWATGNDVITKLTGKLEHINIADYKKSDLIIVYPATANTLGKLANGIDDTPISTVLTVGFGSKTPIVMALAMHASMYDNIAVKKNISFLKNEIDFMTPNIIEGKAKVSEPEEVLDFVLNKFGLSSKLYGKKILITAGPTIEQIDPVRAITNQSSGKTGVSLVKELVSAGAKVTFVYGPGNEIPPKGAKIINVVTSNQMFNAVKKELKNKFDIVIMAAAVADYIPKNPSKKKIKSSKTNISITLKKAPKIIDQIKKIQKNVLLVGFKAETNVTNIELIKSAKKKLKESSSDMIIANDIGTSRYIKNSQYNQIIIVDKKRSIVSGWMKKEKIAKIIKKQIELKIQ